ncbi:prepilin-type N-terminal cleavage/methylation domain-containing protein [Idiomarina seosinensis]|uniref:Prepilin-type cleavage/methylation domain-containing protein n=1 Tax=Idiomarina seosinensis TaxID=281739 RepID=A0A432ZGC7_9GAMM|nr:prepilin-type N-terminal cleavage/methylation domain-containing protein [Idiomarina seosinensis]RUO77055.1 hypothetical protein CWI81_00690 [Idiomarina seosinensis]
MGFSLVELLVALAVTAVLMAAGLPSLRESSERVQMQAMAERWLLLLQEHKARAMESNKPKTVAVEYYNDQWTPPGWRFEHNFRSQAPLMFEGASGFARAGSISITATSLSIKIIISGLGRIRYCQSQGDRLAGMQPC